MATYDLFRNISFTSNTANYDLLASSTAVRDAIKQRLGLTESELTALLISGIPNMSFQIFTTGSTVKVNNEEFQLIDNSVYSSGDYIRKRITSIVITENSTSGIFSFNIL